MQGLLFLGRFTRSTRLSSILAAFCWMMLGISQVHAQTTWNLIWSDEFNGPANSAPNSGSWAYDTGGGGWGNGELEYYCAPFSSTPPCDPNNSNIYEDGNGNLVIRAINNGGTWTSGRMNTSGKEAFQYGRIEARIKMQVGDGFWPAFWMLGNDLGSVGWPTSGEQDIMEWVQSYGPDTTSSHVHGPGYSGANGVGANYTFPNGGRIDDASYHTYGVIWSPNQMQFYRDDPTQPFFTMTPADIPSGDQWVFNNPFFILLNFAIGGGGFPGNIDSSTPTPGIMLVDYVRVYQAATSTGTSGPVSINAGGGATGSYVADADFAGGTAASTTAAINTSNVANAAPQAVYQTERWGASTYVLPGLNPGGQYDVTLQFAEIYWTAAGQRQFNAAINGAQVLTNFDIFAATGGENIAITKTFPATADSNGQITVQFSTGAADQPKISGIQVAPAAAPAAGIASGSMFKLINPESGLALDVAGCGGAGTNVQIWANGVGVCNNGGGQVWQTNLNGDGTYTLVNPESGDALDVANCGGAGANVDTWTNGVNVCNGGGGQKWNIQTNGNSTYTLVNPESGDALDVASCGTTNGTNVGIWTDGVNVCNGGAGQQWQFVSPTGSTNLNGAHVVKAYYNTSFVVDDWQSSTASGNTVDIYTANSTAAQSWNFANNGVVPAGDYNLAVLGANCMEVSGSGTTNGTPVVIAPCNGQPNQSWNAVPSSNGSYMLVPANASNMCLDSPNSTTTPGTALQIWQCHGSTNQNWLIN